MCNSNTSKNEKDGAIEVITQIYKEMDETGKKKLKAVSDLILEINNMVDNKENEGS